jgi:hypothetical protein
MATPHLVQIAYVSALRSELSRSELDTMLSTWRRQNAQHAVTGFILVRGDSVFQVLEGFPDVVRALYTTISRDLRHQLATKLIDEPIAQRSFGDWSMGHARMVRTDLRAMRTLRPFVDPAFRLWQCDETMARVLLAAFATGPWRRSIR